jgi:beta-glucanase (GH16 family)
MFGRIKQPFSRIILGVLFVTGVLCSGALRTYGVTNIVWSDEFNGTNIDLTKWGFDLGNSSTISGSGWGNNEKETYSSAAKNAFVSNGVLHIVALNDVGGAAPYSSARMQTFRKFSVTFGRVEVRAKLPTGSPYWWPAIWMLATNYAGGSNVTNHWPQCGEIDMVESKGSTPNKNLATLHKDSSGSPGNDSSSGVSYTFPTGDGNTNFHNYVMQWGSGGFNFTIDSNTVHYTNNGTINSWSSSIGPFPAPFNHPFYFIMNLAVGGNFVGNPSVSTINSNTTFPGDMQIDYIRVYQDVPSLPGVISVIPDEGCTNGGTAITIIGTNFMSGATVSIGGAAASSVVFVDTNTLTAVTPANPSGTKNVVVTNPDASAGTLVNGFTCMSAPTFAGPDSVTAAVEGATLTWSAASGVPPLTYIVWQGTESFGEEPVLDTNSLSVFLPLYPGSNSPITYFFFVQAVDGCGNNDGNWNELTVQPLIDPNKDQDGDGMSNGFEQQYGFNPFDAADAAADSDGDGLTNLKESMIGADPTDKASPFNIVAITREGDNVRITWADAAGRTDVVDGASEPSGSYSNISPDVILTGSGVGSTNYLDEGAVTNTPLKFYRIRLIP